MKLRSLLLLVFILLLEICHAQSLLKGPQKIVIDAKRNRLLVSNYDTGDIIQIDSTGIQSYFLPDAGFVDGIEIVGDVVYGVGMNRKILGYDLVRADQVFNITILGDTNQYLSSICSDSDGYLFISCPNLNEIYRLRLSDKSYWTFAKGNGLNKPNGILLEKEKKRIVVIDDSPCPSLIHAISLKDSTVTTLAVTSFNKPDGITRDKIGNYYIGGYYLPGLYRINSEFGSDFELFFQGNNMVYPTYDPKDNSLLVTYYGSNSWERVPLAIIPKESEFPELKGPYLGQKPPGRIPVVFAPGIVSTAESHEFAGTFSPDGKEFFFTRTIEVPNNQIMYMTIKDGKWSEPSLSPVAYKCSEAEPHISPDGKRLFYASGRPLQGSTQLASNPNIWISIKTGSSWSEPYLLENPFKERNFLMYVTSANNGTIYFRSRRGIYRSVFENGKYAEPEFLPEEINSPTKGNHPYIAPDESYIIFDTERNPPEGFGSSDLYISFRKSDSSWTKAVNMGESINSKGYEVAPGVSSDGKYFFFESDRAGSMDIYWVSAKIIEELRPKRAGR